MVSSVVVVVDLRSVACILHIFTCLRCSGALPHNQADTIFIGSPNHRAPATVRREAQHDIARV